MTVILGQIGAGHSTEELLADYPYLERKDIMQSPRYAARRVQECEDVLPLHEDTEVLGVRVLAFLAPSPKESAFAASIIIRSPANEP